jgi:hypothetical protein
MIAANIVSLDYAVFWLLFLQWRLTCSELRMTIIEPEKLLEPISKLDFSCHLRRTRYYLSWPCV